MLKKYNLSMTPHKMFVWIELIKEDGELEATNPSAEPKIKTSKYSQKLRFFNNFEIEFNIS